MENNILLKKGDALGIIAPSATAVGQDGVEIQYEHAKELIERMGLKIVFGNHAKGKFFYKAGMRDERISDLHAAFQDTNIAAILALQGGENSNELLPHIDWDIIKSNPKPFFGTSDITVLLNAMYAHTGLVTYHGIDYLWGFGKNGGPITEQYTKEVFFEGRFDYRPFAGNPEWHIIREGTGEGTCIGGCLPSYNLLFGTGHDPLLINPQPFIFIMESIGQTISVIEAEIAQLTQQHYFKKYCKGVIVGYFFLCTEPNVKDNRSVGDIVEEYTRDINIPILEIHELGHAVENLIFPIGGKMIMKSSLTPEIKYEV